MYLGTVHYLPVLDLCTEPAVRVQSRQEVNPHGLQHPLPSDLLSSEKFAMWQSLSVKWVSCQISKFNNHWDWGDTIK